jgi:hypothetical protein
MIALFAALLVQDPYADFSRVVTLTEPWDHIDVREWTYSGLTADENMIFFMQPARQRGMVWVRYEYQVPLDGYLSKRYLAELDCDAWKTRTFEVVAFSENNLIGTTTPQYNSTWGYAAPGTIADKTLEYGCGD